MKNILLKFDEKFFYKMQKHKHKLQIEMQKLISWETYIKILFGMI